MYSTADTLTLVNDRYNLFAREWYFGLLCHYCKPAHFSLSSMLSVLFPLYLFFSYTIYSFIPHRFQPNSGDGSLYFRLTKYFLRYQIPDLLQDHSAELHCEVIKLFELRGIPKMCSDLETAESLGQTESGAQLPGSP